MALAETEVEPADARLQLQEDTWVFRAPSESSEHVARVHASKYVMVTGATLHYARVRLRSGEVGYVPLSAVTLIQPADEISEITHNSVVFEKPNHHSNRVAEVHTPGKVHVIGRALNYREVRMHSGVEGFVPDSAFN